VDGLDGNRPVHAIAGRIELVELAWREIPSRPELVYSHLFIVALVIFFCPIELTGVFN
jgi:hypothetical protein